MQARRPSSHRSSRRLALAAKAIALSATLSAGPLAGCADDSNAPGNDPGNGGVASGPVATDASMRGDDGPRFDADPGAVDGDAPLLPGRRYALYANETEREAGWDALFVDPGLAGADGLPDADLDAPERAAVGVYLGEQRAGDGNGARRHEIRVGSYADDAGAPVVQVDVTIVTDCAAAPATIAPAPWLLETIELPPGTDAADARFVDTVRRTFVGCGAERSDPETLIVASPSRFGVSLGAEPSGADASSDEPYEVGAPEGFGRYTLPAGPDERLVFADELPGLMLPFGLSRVSPDGGRRGASALVGLDAPSDLFEGSIDVEDYLDYLEALAGDGARDCAAEAIAGATGCEADAFAAGTPFLAAYERQGIDSIAWSGKAVTADGRLFVVGFDSDPDGGGRRDAGKIGGFACARAEADGATITCVERYPEPAVAGGDSPTPPGPSPAPPPGEPVDVEILLRGDLAAAGLGEEWTGPTRAVLTNPQDYFELYSNVVCGPAPEEDCDIAAPPSVDFDESVVVFATDGVSGYIGPGVDVDGAVRIDGTITMTILSTDVGEGCDVATALSGPYLFARIDAGSAAVRTEDRFEQGPPC